MRVPLEWLKEYVAVRLSPKELAHRLTMAGLEVVGILDVDGQTVFDLEITPNRADCLSVIGVAREVAAITRQRLKIPVGAGSRGPGAGKANRPRGGPSKHPAPIIRIEDRQGCRRYIGRLLEDVKIGPSPAWMQRRLAACGARPINNVVDITNYVLFEYGQPLHAFDFYQLARKTIVVRRAAANETITTLDEERRALSAGMVVIADASTPVAVAGVMGGMGSEVTQHTHAVLLESALFDPLTVRRTGRALGLSSESSYRFERGVDPVAVETASRRASALMQELAGGRETVVRDAGSKPATRASITVQAPRVSRWLGQRIDPPAIRTTLAQLGCRVASAEGSATLRVTPPTFRQDLREEVDIYEEIARVIGYDRIQSTIPVSPIARLSEEESKTFADTQALKRVCAGLGLTETISWSLVSEAELARCGYRAAAASRVANPLSQDHAYLRPSLLIGLLQTIRRNLTRGAPGVRVFEVGSVVPPPVAAADGGSARSAGPGGPATGGGMVPGSGEERLHVGIGVAGWWSRDWRKKEPSDFWVVKGLLQEVIGRLCRGRPQFKPAVRPWAEPGECAEIQIDGRPAGVAAQVSSAITDEMDLGGPAWVAELAVETLLAGAPADSSIRPPTVFPSVKRDLSVLVPEATAFDEVDRAVREEAGALGHRIELIDRFVKGAQVPRGMYSLTFSIGYRDAARTLTAAEVDALHQRIGQTLVSRFGATLR